MLISLESGLSHVKDVDFAPELAHEHYFLSLGVDNFDKAVLLPQYQEYAVLSCLALHK
jgi:hypothetical protein